MLSKKVRNHIELMYGTFDIGKALMVILKCDLKQEILLSNEASQI